MRYHTNHKLNPNKLLLSKWTAVKPINKEKHFMVIKLTIPDNPEVNIEFIELEAIYTKRCQVLPWQELNNHELWQIGWQ